MGSKSLDLFQAVVEEILIELKIEDYVIEQYIRYRKMIIITVGCNQICELSLANTKVYDECGFLTDLTDPLSVEIIKAIIGMSYDIHTTSEPMSIIKFPWIFGKYVWRLRRLAEREIKTKLKDRLLTKLTHY